MTTDNGINSLIAGFADPDRFRRYASLLAFRIRSNQLPLADRWPHYYALRNDSYAAIRVEVVCATFELSAPNDQAAEVLEQYLQDEDALVRSYAKWALDDRSAKDTPRSLEWLLEEQLGWWRPSWNLSRDDPYWRDWLTSNELYCTLRENIQRLGKPIHEVSGGTVFEYDSRLSCHVLVWISPREVILGYHSPSSNEAESLRLVADQVIQFRQMASPELGQISGGWSYGAEYKTESNSKPVVKWAQAGDWAAMVRNWHLSSGHCGSIN